MNNLLGALPGPVSRNESSDLCLLRAARALPPADTAPDTRKLEALSLAESAWPRPVEYLLVVLDPLQGQLLERALAADGPGAADTTADIQASPVGRLLADLAPHQGAPGPAGPGLLRSFCTADGRVAAVTVDERRLNGAWARALRQHADRVTQALLRQQAAAGADDPPPGRLERPRPEAGSTLARALLDTFRPTAGVLVVATASAFRPIAPAHELVVLGAGPVAAAAAAAAQPGTPPSPADASLLTGLAAALFCHPAAGPLATVLCAAEDGDGSPPAGQLVRSLWNVIGCRMAGLLAGEHGPEGGPCQAPAQCLAASPPGFGWLAQLRAPGAPGAGTPAPRLVQPRDHSVYF